MVCVDEVAALRGSSSSGDKHHRCADVFWDFTESNEENEEQGSYRDNLHQFPFTYRVNRLTDQNSDPIF